MAAKSLLVHVDDFKHCAARLDVGIEIAPTDPEDMALLRFTSGTTGRPKGAIHVHGAVTRNPMAEDELKQAIMDAIREIVPEAEFNELDPDDGLREQLDLDSMDFLNVVIALHEALVVEIPEADYPQLSTMNDAIGYLKKNIHEL